MDSFSALFVSLGALERTVPVVTSALNTSQRMKHGNANSATDFSNTRCPWMATSDGNTMFTKIHLDRTKMQTITHSFSNIRFNFVQFVSHESHAYVCLWHLPESLQDQELTAWTHHHKTQQQIIELIQLFLLDTIFWHETNTRFSDLFDNTFHWTLYQMNIIHFCHILQWSSDIYMK